MAFQAAQKDGNQEQTFHVFDNADLHSIHVQIDSSEPLDDRGLEADFRDASKSFSQVPMKYSDPDTGSQVSLEEFAGLFPIDDFDVSACKEALNSGTADVVVHWTLGSNFEFPVGTPTSDNVYCLIMSERFLRLENVNAWTLPSKRPELLADF